MNEEGKEEQDSELSEELCARFSAMLNVHGYSNAIRREEELFVECFTCPPSPNEKGIPPGVLRFYFSGNWILAHGTVPGWNLQESSFKTLWFCNQWNLLSHFPVAALQGGYIIGSYLWFVSELTTDEFLWDSVFMQFMTASGMFFERMQQEFPALPRHNIYLKE